MLLNSPSHLFVVHPTLSLGELDIDRSRVTVDVHWADFDRSILEQIDNKYDLLLLDWGLETPDARGVLDAFEQNAPDTQILVLSEDVPSDDPADRGANELLVGPHSEETLSSTIERLLLQQAYEEAMNEFFRLSTERALLESELQSGVDATDRYQSIVCNLYESRKQAAAIRDELSSDGFDQTLRQLLDR
ncbi:HalX domain-containing protein [Natronorubrum thiooxidans]|uniref:HalX domain-containing protein n=1 Tax=Natronorubrum thiooxidans TaxID=308853 RepID=A0A1N7GA05_9EURY|nr:HalX domain-containing protein [Natronorubrum thiooxidans]SIS09336.1 HalX domain-containing protein [Natronorubrum thiooxidans]